ncbi:MULTISPECIES: SIMPL domain-containing protein [Alteromonadaceae]|uniref:SIMPL domain-containing protein n=1 Tax=Alteromonadaceae TaxID=72275 RepID=UPI001C09334C|nr:MULTISPECIES: SIMPL domain-containing protein [Aliiglaciecola]MBU2877039.1 SIMPL domain-containing protein [Aliiglaciecola lipolytica]MDO6712266.1 SIMPL domain-containing protein [Aliiglaciecola sp. 2_MG-2023]MDO6753328.1 SIMPL domain-containing protein [Aliiglaciecola sp. 1_MG-2023]
MQTSRATLIFSAALIISSAILGYFLEQSVERFRAFERTITVKGLSEHEVPADTAIWPIQYSVISDDLADLYKQLEIQQSIVEQFLLENNFSEEEISASTPTINDKKAQNYGSYNPNDTRFTANQTFTVYSEKIDTVLQAQTKLLELGKRGLVLNGNSYENQTQFLYSGLNQIKPNMIEDATQKAREVAEKFAADSNSQLGKIKQARQGQFSISDRDSNTPHIKQVRVVSTIEYYLID